MKTPTEYADLSEGSMLSARHSSNNASLRVAETANAQSYAILALASAISEALTAVFAVSDNPEERS